MLKRFFPLIFLLPLLIHYGCAPAKPVIVYQRGEPPKSSAGNQKPAQTTAAAVAPKALSPSSSVSLAAMGYTIQAGAFSVPENAAAMTDRLDIQGLDPYFFKDQSGLYKVRFGNFNTKDEARKYAQSLRSKNVIAEFYVVSPSEYTAARVPKQGAGYLRDELVKSAEGYIGVPYKWGGTGAGGIDCSGLTQAVYNLNGLSIPRNSGAQYSKGSAVAKNKLQKGDLVFFATGGGGKVSHVGIYIGGGRFIHAPSRGKKVCIEQMSTPYFLKTYVGARSYI